MIKTVRNIIKVLIIIILFLFISIIYLTSIRGSDLRKQKKHLTSVINSYENYEPIGYQDYASSDISNLALNEVKFLASHNSYKKQGSALGRFFVGLFDSFSEARALKYSYKPLTEQLQSGIYSFELDIRLRKNEFEVTHVPLVDNSSNSVNFRNALEEINLFIENEDETFPIIVLLEIKDDYMFLDPFLNKIESEELIKLEEVIIDVLGDKVYSPLNLINNEINLKESVDKGWPTVEELSNKVLFVVHAGKYSRLYSQTKQIDERVLFTAKYYDEIDLNSVFVIHNSINISRIQDLVSNNYIVRTRIGSTTSYTEEQLNNALVSGAQILTTDFSIARSDIKEHLYLEDKKYTIIKRG